MNVVELTQKLIAFDTVNPPGNEAEAMTYCASLLSKAGFDCDLRPMAGNNLRTNLIATRGTGVGQAIGFSGHLDTVPLGAAPWRFPPHAGDISAGRLFGRGASDMKGGIAAFISACHSIETPPGGIAIILTYGEETGCDGARALVQEGNLPDIGALIVGESTDNCVVHGHKGVLWLSLTFHGKTAHAAMPDQGVNAIGKAVSALQMLSAMDLGDHHPIMGAPTLNIGTIHGGLNTNSVPDQCTVTIDLRTLPDKDHATLLETIQSLSGQGTDVSTLLNLAPVWSQPDHRWIRDACRILHSHTGQAGSARSVNYFTDASLLTNALGNPPTIILGPGSTLQAHKTDEWVDVEKLKCAERYMGDLIGTWGG